MRKFSGAVEIFYTLDEVMVIRENNFSIVLIIYSTSVIFLYVNYNSMKEGKMKPCFDSILMLRNHLFEQPNFLNNMPPLRSWFPYFAQLSILSFTRVKPPSHSSPVQNFFSVHNSDWILSPSFFRFQHKLISCGSLKDWGYVSP